MKHGEYDVVHYEDKYLRQTLDLLSMLWVTDPRSSRAYFEWKYVHNPCAGASMICLALHRDRVVGVRPFYPASWQVNEPPLRLSCLLDADAIVHPEHRRQGLHKKMTVAGLQALARTSYSHVITLSGGAPSSAMNLSLGWRSVAPLQSVQWNGTSAAAGKPAGRGAKMPFRDRLGEVVGCFWNHRIQRRESPFAELDRRAGRAGLKESGKIVVAKEPRPEAMSSLVRNHCRGGRFRHLRDEEFFRWRFQNPLSIYRFLFWQTDRLNGYLVVRKPIHCETNLINIVDWETDQAEVLRGLLEAATRVAGSAFLRTWSATLLKKEQEVFREAGFRPVCSRPGAFTPSILVRPIDLDNGNGSWRIGDRSILEPGTWDLRPIYSDDL